MLLQMVFCKHFVNIHVCQFYINFHIIIVLSSIYEKGAIKKLAKELEKYKINVIVLRKSKHKGNSVDEVANLSNVQ